MGEQFCGRNSVKLPDKWKKIRYIQSNFEPFNICMAKIPLYEKGLYSLPAKNTGWDVLHQW